MTETLIRGSGNPRPFAKRVPVEDDAVPRVSVAFYPFDAGNPYQGQLAHHLRLLGVEVLTPASLKAVGWGTNNHPRHRIVHLHWLPQFRGNTDSALRLLLFLTRLTRSRLAGCRLVWTVHNLSPHEGRYPALDQCLASAVGHLAAGIITHSASASLLVGAKWRHTADKLTVVRHPNYIDSYPNQISRAEARGRLAVSSSTAVFLFFGHVRPYKGVERLIQAFRSLKSADVALLIVGRPLNETFRQEVEAAIAGDWRIKFLPRFVPADEVQLYMNASDAVVFPYVDSLTSGGLLLAMSFGRFCIVPDVSTFKEDVDNQGSCTFEPQSPGSLARCLNTVLVFSDQLLERGAWNKSQVAGRTWQEAAQATFRVYETALR